MLENELKDNTQSGGMLSHDASVQFEMMSGLDSLDGLVIDDDGVIEVSPPSRAKAVFKRPTFMDHALAGATDSLRRVVNAIVDVDVAISMYAELLTRAQPLNSGRVVIVFTKSHRVMREEKCFYDTVPVPMRMVLYISGTWHLKRVPAYEKLEELRVGKSLSSDRLVVQLLRELDKLFAARLKLVSYLSDFRVPSVPASRSAVAQADSSVKRLEGLQSRLRLDWKDDAKGCRQAIRDDLKRRTQARKKDATPTV